MAHFAPVLALGTGALLLPHFNKLMFGPQVIPEQGSAEGSDKGHDDMMIQYAHSGMPVHEHQYNSGWRKFNVDAPPVDTFVAHVDPFENPNAIRERYEETVNFWDKRKGDLLRDIKDGRSVDYLPRKKMPLVHTITREIRHPNTGKSTGFINNAFMPEHANAAQRQRAQNVLAVSGLEDDLEARATGQGVFRHAHGQSFRHRQYG